MKSKITLNGINFYVYPKSKNRSHRDYYKAMVGSGKNRTSLLLHRYIWETHNNQKIPDGYSVHHKDGNPHNNMFDNLELVKTSDHASNHANKNWANPDIAVKMLKNLDTIRSLTKKWHGSEEGLKWHREHGKKIFGNRKKARNTCLMCQKSYWADFLSLRAGAAKFCHQNCKMRYRKRRLRGLVK